MNDTFKTALAALLLAAPLGAAEVSITVETPSRSPRGLGEVPGAVEALLPGQVEQAAGVTLDEKLQALVPGLNSNRGAGLYAHGSNLAMRGMPGGETGQAMTLVMVDGVPLNSAATGGVQWNALKDLDIERVEIFKGPGSSLYGSNAMAGAVNIITRKPRKGLDLETGYGTYNTLKTRVRAGGGLGRLSVSAEAGTLSSDGYITAPKSLRNAYTIKSDAREKSAGAKAVYAFKEMGALELKYDYFKGRNGAGSNETVDQYREKVTNRLQASWKAGRGDWSWHIAPYFLRTDDENVSQKGGTAAYADIVRKDLGAMVSVSRGGAGGLLASGGVDLRFGVLDGRDSSGSPSAAPFSYDRGKTGAVAPYLQLERKFLEDRLTLAAGLRYDRVSLYDAFTQNTSHANFSASNGPLPDKRWEKFSPRLAAGWKYSDGLSQYASWSRGFRAPPLENMTLSLKRGTRYQIANPDLDPETADTAETGLKWNPLPGLYADPSVYYTRAKDLIYYTLTASPFYKYRNMARVEIRGFELPVKYAAGALTLNASWALSRSEVKEGVSDATDIKGKRLTFAPGQIYSAGASYSWERTRAGLTWLHKSRQYTSDTNATSLPGYSLTSASVSRRFSERLNASLACDNIFNEVYTEDDDSLSPGRVFTASLKLLF